MSPRGGPPLFDLISSRREPSAGPPPARAGRRREERPTRGRATATTGRLSVPVPWIYAACGAVLLLLLGAYGIGYSVGWGSREAEVLELAQQGADEVFIEDPLRDDAETTAAPPPARTGGGTRAGEPARTPPEPEILTARGPVRQDPRREGFNYLELATLPREMADEAIRYLAAQQVEAIAVPEGLDRGRLARNTSDRYRVIALGLAVPSGAFSSSAAERRRFEQRMGELGKRWTEMGGASDFSSPLWRRFGG